MANIVGSVDSLALAVALFMLTGVVPARSVASAEPVNSAKQGAESWWGSKATPGWDLMSSVERDAYRNSMQRIRDYESCKAYMAQHSRKMEMRAKERGQGNIPKPQHDPCVDFKS